MAQHILYIDENLVSDIMQYKSYHVFVVGVESLINERDLIWTQPLLVIGQLGELVERRNMEREK